MPVSVPTLDEFQALEDQLDAEISELDVRVAALEAGNVPPDPPPDPKADYYSVVIAVGGQRITLHQRDAIQLDDYNGPTFTQRCYLAEHPRLPAECRVWFRPDTALADDEPSTRMEIIIETGTVRANSPARNIDQYTITILCNRRFVHRQIVSGHWYRARWRWQSAPRAVLLTWEQVQASPYLPHYDAGLAFGCTPNTSPCRYEQAMDLAGIFPSMGATGERNDIGPVTEYIAEYLCTGSETARASLLAQAEGSGSLPWHFRDEETLAPLDTLAYPTATLYAAGPTSQWPTITMPSTADTGISLDVAHQPQLAAVAYILTGDAYYLEELQFATTYNLLSGPRTAPAQWGTGQVRAYAWCLRTLALCAALTPADAPRWLLPKAYWEAQLEACRVYSEARWIDKTDVNYTKHAQVYDTFHVIGANFGDYADGNLQPGCYCDSWQEDFATTIVAWVVCLGFENWRRMLDYKAADTIARCDGSSGWVRARASVYEHPLRDSEDAPWYGGYAEAWDGLERLVPDLAIYTDPDQLAPTVGEPIDRFCYARGALAMAVRAGVTKAQAPLDWINAELERLITSWEGFARWKWCIRP